MVAGRQPAAALGLQFGDQTGDYDYSLQSTIFDPLITPVRPMSSTGRRIPSSFGSRTYAAWRTRLGSRLTAEAGARWDRYRYDHGLEFNATSPRLNLVYAAGEAGELRAAWGVVHQPQSINELQVEDDVEQFFAPERVTQWVLGYTHRFALGFSARLDIYDKRYADLRARYEKSSIRCSSFRRAAPIGFASLPRARAPAESSSRCVATRSAASRAS